MMVESMGTRIQPEAGLLRCLDGSKPRVLLAEDSDAARILTAALLRRMGCQVDAVEHGEEALSHVQNFSYDLILLDIEMPIMDGVIAAREIRALGGAAGSTPLMALSAFLADTSKCGHWQETFDVALAKPAGRDDLRGAIQSALASKVHRNALGASSQPPSSNASNEQLIDKAQMAQVKAHLSPLAWRQLVEAVAAEMRDTVKAIAFAQSAGESGAVAQNAHRLKGIARSFAAPKLAHLAEQIERKAIHNTPEDLEGSVMQLRKVADTTLLAIATMAERAA
jgi:CheY-like chemotaxis protein/HPt (histidine-containing phosphotransfer) domain-containing protein